MTRAAVALASADQAAGARPAANPDLERQLDSLGGQVGYKRRFRPGRPQLLLLAMAVLAVWLVLVFGRALSDLNEATERQSLLTAETAALNARLDAGHRELELVQTDSFQALQARSFGMGGPGELVFSLEPGAPEALPIVPLGATATTSAAKTPLETWLDLLFGD
jgi:hypothetical protein